MKALTQSIYVDDVVAGADSEDEGYTLYMASKENLSYASFNLRKFVTNSAALQDKVDTEEIKSKEGTNSKTKSTTVEASEEAYVEATSPLNLLIELENRRYLESVGMLTWINLCLSSLE